MTVCTASARRPALCNPGPSDEPSVTFVNFGASERGAADAHGAIPGGGEQAGIGAAAEAIGALPAHAGGFRGGGNAAGASEGFEEDDLADGCPAIEAAFRKVHRPVWSTKRVL